MDAMARIAVAARSKCEGAHTIRCLEMAESLAEGSGFDQLATCLSALVTDWAMETWYHSFIA